MNSEFPRIITLQRKERKISQKQAAADLGISQALLSHYEKGIRECGLDFLIKIADYYNVSCDYLLGRTASPEEKFTGADSTQSVLEDIDSVSDSAALLLSLCGSEEDKLLEQNVYSYISLSLYKLFRILQSDSDSLMFHIPEDAAENLADAVIMKNCAAIKLKSRKSECITTTELSDKYPQASSFMKLIKSSEDKITELCE